MKLNNDQGVMKQNNDQCRNILIAPTLFHSIISRPARNRRA
jgi:hypothetical protein